MRFIITVMTPIVLRKPAATETTHLVRGLLNALWLLGGVGEERGQR